jgi:hypothetical protein
MARARYAPLLLAASALGLSPFACAVQAVDTSDTRLLATPAITEGKIAFVYADDLRVANTDGSDPRRLISHPGEQQSNSRSAFQAAFLRSFLFRGNSQRVRRRTGSNANLLPARKIRKNRLCSLT